MRIRQQGYRGLYEPGVWYEVSRGGAHVGTRRCILEAQDLARATVCEQPRGPRVHVRRMPDDVLCSTTGTTLPALPPGPGISHLFPSTAHGGRGAA